MSTPRRVPLLALRCQQPLVVWLGGRGGAGSGGGGGGGSRRGGGREAEPPSPGRRDRRDGGAAEGRHSGSCAAHAHARFTPMSLVHATAEAVAAATGVWGGAGRWAGARRMPYYTMILSSFRPFS
jgi:hypothetical protein